MKRCLTCHKEYTDETLNFCLDDGEWLVGADRGKEDETAILPVEKLPSEAPTRISEGQRENRAGSGAGYLVSEIKRHRLGAILALGVLALLIAGAALVIPKIRNSSLVSKVPPAMKVTRLTSSGRVLSAAISPDGKYVAYVQLTPTERHTLWVRQVSAATDLQILPEEEGVTLTGLAFAPDGEHILFVKTKNNNGMLFRTPVIGGNTSRLPIENIGSNISVSPDGKRVAFVRRNRDKLEQSLMIANIDGSGERSLTPLDLNVGGFPAWSPDAKSITIDVGDVVHGRGIFSVSVDDGAVKPFSEWRWFGNFSPSIAWLADGSGIVISAAEAGLNPQIMAISYPDGATRQITTELSTYGSINLTSDSSTICAVRSENTANLWISDTSDPDNPKRVTSGTERRDGERGLHWSPDDRQIFYYSAASGGQHIWAIAPDGSGNRQVTPSARRNRDAFVSGDGKYIVWESNRGEGNAIWRMNFDGTNPIQLTEGPTDYWPEISPDGKWVLFSRSPVGGTSTIWRTSIDGGAATLITEVRAFGAAISPDGTQIVLPDARNAVLNRISIIPFDGGPPTFIFEVPDGSLPPVRWTPDGKSVAYLRQIDGVSNIWIQALSGVPAKQLTHFKELKTRNFAWSRDGKRIAFSRGSSQSDVVLIKDFR